MARIIFLLLALGFSSFSIAKLPSIPPNCSLFLNVNGHTDPNYRRNECGSRYWVQQKSGIFYYSVCYTCSQCSSPLINDPVTGECKPETDENAPPEPPSCNIGEEVWADYEIEDEMPVCTGGCTGTRSPGACYGGGIGCSVKFTITGPCEEDTCEGDECTSGGEQSSSSSDDSESSSSEPSTSSSSDSNSSSGNGGDGDGDGDGGDGNGNGSGSGSSSGNTGGGDDDSGDESSSSGECDPTSSNYFECAGLIEDSTSSAPDISYEVSSAVGKVHDDQIQDIQDFQGVSFSDKADFFKSKLESFLPVIPTCTPITLQFSYFNVSETIPCEKFDVIKRLLAWVLSFSTVWYIFQLAIKPVNR